MAFSTGNSQFDFLLSRARNRKRSRQALEENNINVQTSQEKREESESEEVTTVGSQVADISGLAASGISTTDVSVSAGSQSITDAQEMMDIAGVGKGQTVGQVAFDTEMDRAKADFAQSNPIGAAIAGISTDAVVQGAIQTAPLGLAMAGQMDAARAVANVGSVLSGPAFGAISGVIGPSMQDPYGQNVAMGSGLLGQVSQSLMSTHYSVADKVAQGVPGYTQGYYGTSLVSTYPGIFGPTFSTTAMGYTLGMPLANAPYSLQKNVFKNPTPSYTGPPNAMTKFGRFGLDPNTIATYGSLTDFGTAMSASKNTGYYGTVAQAVIDAKAGNKKAQSFLTEIEDTKGIETTGDLGGIGDLGSGYGIGTSTGTGSQTIGGQDVDPSQGGTTSGGAVGSTGGLGGATGVGGGYGGPNDGDGGDSGPGGAGDPGAGVGEYKKGGRIGMAMGDVPQSPSTDMGFIGGPPDQFTKQQTIADDIPKEVPEGTFVINAPAVEFAGKEDIKQMLVEAYEIIAQADTDAGTDRTAQAAKISSKEQVDIMISRGEVVVPPEIAKVIGYDRLEKINNRGKKEVARRQEESEQQEKPQARQVAEGGFIGMRDGGITEGRRLPDPNKFDQNIADFLGVFDDAEDARINSRLYTDTYKPKDDDKTEDMVRHILGSGYMADNMLGSFGFDYKEEAYRPLGKLYDKAYKFATGKDRFVPEYDKTIRKESSIDLNNNKYGRLLREKYPDKKEFTKQVFLIGSSMAKGEDPSKFVIDGLQPQLSLGSQILDKAGSDKDIAIRKKLKEGAEKGAFDPFADYNKQGNLQN
jgi:hypothetical protein